MNKIKSYIVGLILALILTVSVMPQEAPECTYDGAVTITSETHQVIVIGTEWYDLVTLHWSNGCTGESGVYQYLTVMTQY